MNEPYQAPSVVVITVHGTFARRATWIMERSPLMLAVSEFFAARRVRCHITPFRWSGRNSIPARIRAGEDLVKFVAEQRQLHSDSPIYIVAHSHGGSVVAYASKASISFRETVAGVIALSTPWISVTPNPRSAIIRRHIVGACLTIGFLLLLVATTPIAGLFLGLVSVGWLMPGNAEETLMPMAVGIVIGMIAYAALLGMVYYGIVRRSFLRRLTLTESRFLNVVAETAKAGDTLDAPLPKTAIVRASSDEVSLLGVVPHAVELW